MTEPDEEFSGQEFSERGEEHLRPETRDLEAPAPDVVEQATPANPADLPGVLHRGLEVNDWDAVEQAQVVEIDEDYR